jgi:hypothetical protein
VTATGDPAIPIWSAGLEAPAVERAFGRPLRVVEEAATPAGSPPAASPP